jgi:transmembrane protein
MTARPIETLLASRATEAIARVLLTFPFWGSGLDKLIKFGPATAEMAQFGLQPAWVYAIATIVVQLGGSALIILRRWTWLGAGALGVFTALTIPIVHAFWRFEGDKAVHAIHTAGEHVGMIGGLILVSILALRPSGSARSNPNPSS